MLQCMITDYCMKILGPTFSSTTLEPCIAGGMDNIGPLVDYLGNKNYFMGNKVTMPDLFFYEAVDTVLAVC